MLCAARMVRSRDVDGERNDCFWAGVEYGATKES